MSAAPSAWPSVSLYPHLPWPSATPSAWPSISRYPQAPWSTTLPTASSNANAAASSQLVVIAASVASVLCFFAIVVCICFNYFYVGSSKNKNDVANRRTGSLYGVYKDRNNSMVMGSNPASQLGMTRLNSTDATLKSFGTISSGGQTASRRRSSVDEIFASIPRELSIGWDEIRLLTQDRKKAILGKGSFGVVVMAQWTSKHSLAGIGQDVAIKVFSKGLTEEVNFESLCEKVLKEAMIMKHAEKFLISDCYVKVHGIVHGSLPQHLSSVFGVNEDIKAGGLVMRYEGGGDVTSYIYNSSGGPKAVSITDKLSLIHGIIKALAELHSVGIIHGDLKPDNVLLQSIANPEVRLADFGLSAVRGDHELKSGSTLHQTSSTKGTLAYCAPEMLFNPFNKDGDITVARASRKTDMYAFAVVAWEILSQKKPFVSVKSEAELGWNVHQGLRPPIESVPDSTPTGIVELIKAAWDGDRKKRPTAIESYAITNFHYLFVSKKQVDIFFSHAWLSKPFLSHVYAELVSCGYRVWYDQNDMGHNIEQSMSDGIQDSKVVIACVNQF